VVRLDPPPPNRPVDPCFWDIHEGNQLVRIFDPVRRNATALTFRAYGPIKRFDHHRGAGPDCAPAEDLERAVYYAAWSENLPQALSSCLVEVFGDVGIVEPGERRVALPRLVRPLHLLDLRSRGAMRAGTVAAIAKCEHRLSQPWSRYYYESGADFGSIDGLFYLNAHNDEDALLLYERALDALRCDEKDIVPLDDPWLRPLLLEIMRANNLVW
jgi:hypothetical protein